MIQAGTATRIITPPVGACIQAATHEKTAASIHDELEANVLFLRGAPDSVLLIGCDVAGLEQDVHVRAREAIAAATGIPARQVVVFGTHTHAGPCVIHSNPYRQRDAAWHETLHEHLVAGALEAVAAVQPCRLGAAAGQAEIGYNRRVCWADGTHTMFGDVTRPDFTGIEGPHDPRHFTIVVETVDGETLAVVHNNSCHPVNFYGADFFSADYPGLARQLIRDAVGRDAAVLYMNGGFGDDAPMDVLRPHTDRGGRERCMRKQAYIVAGETLRLMGIAAPAETDLLRHRHTDVRVPVRLPDPAVMPAARDTLAKGLAEPGSVPRWELLFAFGRCRLVDAFNDRPWDDLAVHAVRIGDAAIVTQPCELYSQFMIDLRRRSPTPTTLVADVADGYGGYCPTLGGMITGGYSGEAIHWTRLAPAAGHLLVDAAAGLLHGLWQA